ncbi:hypothetical protein [Spiroplasma alleghenense]|uniref:Uncharacterized protein n=1 Tax=Spiroplasma alleghenense TaxID=216931 RepID=A0A345Z3N5_9MOLU|nr:hypothetical protein [Spiroplasma alleghenense]AXK51214.1 hypothetical protein SALLE_v1c05400 [Spiroplasma alleghenense]
MKANNLYFKMFWHNFKTTIRKPIIIIIAVQIILSSLITSALFLFLLKSTSKPENQNIELALNIFAIKKFIQVLLFGILQIVLIVELFHNQIASGKINLELRSGKNKLVIYLEKFFVAFVFSVLILLSVMILDFSINYWSDYNFIYFYNLYSYLFYFFIVLAVMVITIFATMAFKYISALIISMTLTVLVSFSQISGFAYAFSNNTEKLEFTQRSVQANLELKMTFDFYQVLKKDKEFENFYNYFDSLFKYDESNFEKIFAMEEMGDEYPLIIKNINKTFENDNVYIFNFQDDPISALPFNSNYFFNYNNYLRYNFKKSLNYLIENYQGSESELDLLKFISTNFKLFEKIFLLNNNSKDFLIRASDNYQYKYNEQLWNYFNHNYGAVFSSWLILNFSNNVFNISNSLANYINDYNNQINKNLKNNLIFNPMAQLQNMSQGASGSLIIDGLISSFPFSILNYSLNNNFIKVNYSKSSESNLAEIINEKSDEGEGNSFWLDLQNNEAGYKSYYDLVDKLKEIHIVPFWSLYIFYYCFIIGIAIGSYFVFRKSIYN